MDFDLGKIPNKKYFSIQEVSEILDIETHTIRYWEKEFANSFSIKRIGNRRMFQQRDIINMKRNGSSYEEIANELNIKIGTVMSNLSRIKEFISIEWERHLKNE